MLTEGLWGRMTYLVSEFAPFHFVSSAHSSEGKRGDALEFTFDGADGAEVSSGRAHQDHRLGPCTCLLSHTVGGEGYRVSHLSLWLKEN